MARPASLIADPRTVFYRGGQDWQVSISEDSGLIQLSLLDPEDEERRYRTVLAVLSLTEEQALNMLTELTRAILDPTRKGLR